MDLVGKTNSLTSLSSDLSLEEESDSGSMVDSIDGFFEEYCGSNVGKDLGTIYFYAVPAEVSKNYRYENPTISQVSAVVDIEEDPEEVKQNLVLASYLLSRCLPREGSYQQRVTLTQLDALKSHYSELFPEEAGDPLEVRSDLWLEKLDELEPQIEIYHKIVELVRQNEPEEVERLIEEIETPLIHDLVKREFLLTKYTHYVETKDPILLHEANKFTTALDETLLIGLSEGLQKANEEFHKSSIETIDQLAEKVLCGEDLSGSFSDFSEQGLDETHLMDMARISPNTAQTSPNNTARTSPNTAQTSPNNTARTSPNTEILHSASTDEETGEMYGNQDNELIRMIEESVHPDAHRSIKEILKASLISPSPLNKLFPEDLGELYFKVESIEDPKIKTKAYTMLFRHQILSQDLFTLDCVRQQLPQKLEGELLTSLQTELALAFLSQAKKPGGEYSSDHILQMACEIAGEIQDRYVASEIRADAASVQSLIDPTGKMPYSMNLYFS